jgi:hypothetical protein
MTVAASTSHLPEVLHGAWARLIAASAVVTVVTVTAVVATAAARAAGEDTAHRTLDQVRSALMAEHDAGADWPSDLVVAGSRVIDIDTGNVVTGVPTGVSVDYVRSVDGDQILLTISDRGASATYDSAGPLSR